MLVEKVVTMMRKMALMAMLAVAGAGMAHAGDFGEKQDAVALVKKGIAYTAGVGPTQAFADFSSPAHALPWVDRDLYLFVLDKAGNRVAHGQNAKLVGKSILEMIDPNGRSYGREIMDLSNSKGSGWVDYTFTDPISHKQLPKAVYVERNGDYTFCAGVYIR